MLYKIAADTVALLHFGFILFVIGGGFFVLIRTKIMWIHIPAAVWGALIEFAGWYCPLTPLENYFRLKAGDSGITGGFIENYLLRIIYPGEMTRTIQILLGLSVIIINIAVYGYILFRHYQKNRY